MNYIEVVNKYGSDIEEIEVMKDFINYCACKLKLKNVMFNVIIINDKKIHILNKKYRNINRSTDVITFALEDYKDVSVPGIRMLGDVYISYDKVVKQACDYGHSRKREICFLAVHGLLHLLGYDHMDEEEEKKMFNLQKELLDGYGVKKEG